MVYFRTNVGRLGNSLFILAYALYLKKEHGQSFILSHLDQYKYFSNSEVNHLINWLKSQFFFRLKVKLSPFKKREYLDLKTLHQPELTSGNFKVIGYFQSEKYFEKHKGLILNSIKLKKKYRRVFQNKFGELFFNNHITVIHVRRSDYKNHKIPDLGIKNVVLPIRYYQDAIKKIPNQNTKYVLVGDELSYLQNSFNFLPNKFIIHENEIIDFQALMNANICIISNSTFAWWGSYLNKCVEAVIAPKNFLGYNYDIEFPSQIYPKEWIQI